MTLLAKLKTATAGALAVLALAGGFGFGLLPARADEGRAIATGSATATGAAAPRPLTDAEFLRRLCLDLTGNLPSLVEMGYFTADPDENKRRKVVDWMAESDSVREHLAARLGVAADRVRLVRLANASTGKLYRLGVTTHLRARSARRAALRALAVTPDASRAVLEKIVDARPRALVADYDSDGAVDVLVGVEDAEVRSVLFGVGVNSDAGASGGVVLNERSFDVADSVWVDLDRPYGIEVLVAGQADPVTVREHIAWVVEERADQGLLFLGTEVAVAADTDEAFLRRVIEAARGAAPTALEAKYFAEDKDPKKREKLIDLLLKDPALAKKLGNDWKKKMLEPPAAVPVRTQIKLAEPVLTTVRLRAARTRLLIHQPQPDRFETLVGELFGANKTDEQVLEAVTLAALGRLPTAPEKLATLAVIGTAQDRKAAWVGVAKALAASEEGKKHAPAPPAK